MALSLRESICQATRLPRCDDVILGRAELLLPRERLLVEAIVVRGQPVKTVAWMMGVSPRTIRRRVRRLCERMTSPAFLDAARSLHYLQPDDAKLARLHFCGGMSHRQLVRELGLSVHTIRRRLDGIRAQIAMITRTRRRPAQIGA